LTDNLFVDELGQYMTDHKQDGVELIHRLHSFDSRPVNMFMLVTIGFAKTFDAMEAAWKKQAR
jgi:hypothetical protein